MEDVSKIEEQNITEEYDRRAALYGSKDAVLDAGAGARVNTYYDYISWRWIKKYLQPLTRDSILEIGCGMGRITSRLSPLVKRLTAVDISPELLELARQSKLPNTTFYNTGNGLSTIPSQVFDKVLINWVLIHIEDEVIIDYLGQLDEYTRPGAFCYVFEQCNPHQRNRPTSIHIHRVRDEYVKLFESQGWQCVKSKRLWRMPSYGLSYWNKYARIPLMALPLLAAIDGATLYRKPRFIDYTTEAFIFKKR